MHINQCIILAGGLGTRLRSAVANLPKCMAPVADKPFLYWVITYLQQQKVTSFVLSLGYMHEIIEAYIKKDFPDVDIIYSIENEPLGTGGAIYLAMQKCTEENVLVVNGDTLFRVNNEILLNQHLAKNSACSLALKQMTEFSRYGVVKIDNNKNITSFEEKRYQQTGLINGGVYLINSHSFLQEKFPQKFSFEKDYLEKKVNEIIMIGVQDDGYFIDIGIPEDFAKANKEIKLKYDV